MSELEWQELTPAQPSQAGEPVDLGPDRTMWTNDRYVVIREEQAAPDGGPPAVYLSIRRQDRKPVRSWRDFQRIKNQLAGPEYEGVELYPAESRKVDGANQYHLWCFPWQFPFGFHDRLVVNPETAAAATGAVQTAMEEVDLVHGGYTDPTQVDQLARTRRPRR